MTPRNALRSVSITRPLAALVCVTLAGLSLACGDPSAEEKIEVANEQVLVVEREIEAARAAFEREQEELSEAQEELASAKDDLEAAEARLEEAKARVAEAADDAYLFRTVQGTLLNDDSLKGLAISARVSDRVVTLEGNVPKPAQREHAEALAKQVLGVDRVENRVKVAPVASPVPAP